MVCFCLWLPLQAHANRATRWTKPTCSACWVCSLDTMMQRSPHTQLLLVKLPATPMRSGKLGPHHPPIPQREAAASPFQPGHQMQSRSSRITGHLQKTLDKRYTVCSSRGANELSGVQGKCRSRALCIPCRAANRRCTLARHLRRFPTGRVY